MSSWRSMTSLAMPDGLWDPEGRRLTLFLHPGRIKRGVAMHEALGLALRPGRRYRLVVDREAEDAGATTCCASGRSSKTRRATGRRASSTSRRPPMGGGARRTTWTCGCGSAGSAAPGRCSAAFLLSS